MENLAYIKLAQKKSKLTAIAMEWRHIFKKKTYWCYCS